MRATTLSAALAISLTVATADAATLFFDSEAAFDQAASAAGISLITEDFEDDAIVRGITTLQLLGSGIVVDTDDRDLDLENSPNFNDHGLNFATNALGASLTFSHLDGFHAFAIDMLDLANNRESQVTLRTSDGDEQVFTLARQPGKVIRTFGAVNALDPFVSVTFTHEKTEEHLLLDNIRFNLTSTTNVTTPVPEPGGLALLLVGGAGLAARRRSAKRT